MITEIMNKKRLLLCSCEMPNEIISELERNSAECLKLPPSSALPIPVASHPDMLFFSACSNAPTEGKVELFSAENYRVEYPFLFSTLENKLAKSTISYEISTEGIRVGNKYPNDIALNALEMNGILYSLTEHTASGIRDMFSKHIRIKQGYAACSVLKLSEQAAITADINISNALQKNGIDVLLISAGNIRLSGYDYGFIGGASYCDGERVYFFGNVAKHPDYTRILEFCRKHGIEVAAFSNMPLTDLGGIRVIKVKSE